MPDRPRVQTRACDSRLTSTRLLALLVFAIVALTSCTSTTKNASGTTCSDTEELLDTRSFHVIDAGDATFDIHPPTSGPHTTRVPDDGMHADPVAEAVQVSALEHGMVVVNYSESVSTDQLATLEELTRTKYVLVTPAPVPIDDDRDIAFTAWGVRRLCDDVALTEARAFVREHIGAASGHS